MRVNYINITGGTAFDLMPSLQFVFILFLPIERFNKHLFIFSAFGPAQFNSNIKEEELGAIGTAPNSSLDPFYLRFHSCSLFM